MLAQPRSGRFVAWGNAYLAGLTSLDEAAMRIVGDDGAHRVDGIPDEADEVGLTVALGRLRSHGVAALRLVLPVPGDPGGLPGPAEFNVEAIDTGEAVLTVGGPALGMLPEVRAFGPEGDQEFQVRWRVHGVQPAAPAAAPSLSEAERQLKEALLAAAEELARLDAARWRPEAAAALAAIRGHGADLADVLPTGYPPRAVRVLALAQRVHAIAELAAEDGGGTVSASATLARSAALRPLGRCARNAQAAAYNVLAEVRRS